MPTTLNLPLTVFLKRCINAMLQAGLVLALASLCACGGGDPEPEPEMHMPTVNCAANPQACR